ncbi:MAG TPA: lysylphosphatidylglycerol synthase transmembrane domain-containing protein [Acidimicrobiales bacterium]|nr:lysylphosphatidylglycerol synthase transmembrane domain-containing protein [Acidimicrobiales bacterium]
MTPEERDNTESDQPDPELGPGPQGGTGTRPTPGIESQATDTPDTYERIALRIEEDVEKPLPWRTIAKRTAMVLVAGITIYLVFPSLAEVFSSFPKLTSLDPIWFTLALAFEVAHFVCTIGLQRIALGTKAWFSVATSQLAGNSISLVVPGGAAVGAATQFRMLAKAGNDTAAAVGGLTVFSLLQIGGLLALPIFVLPAIIAGTPIARSLEYTALLGLVAFVLFAGFGAAVLVLDGPMRWVGRVVQVARNRFRRNAVPMTDLPERLVRERNRIRVVLGRRWKAATLLSSGRLLLDYGCLLASIRATGAKPNPSLVLLAYAVAKLLALIPITPGGLGIVEAGLSGLLIVAGVPGGDAVVATLAYRIISYWLPILVGPFAYVAFRLRYGKPDHGSNQGADGTGAAFAGG